tara:strand:- start:367 stop:654 length:288 start_codon:yes stop_codon:yes gene_type:complete
MPAVCRIGHADIPHCSGMVRQGGSSNVFVNGIGISRQTDVNTLHKKPPAPCPKHAKGITTGSLTVKVNGKGCGRIGDPITGCTMVSSGSDNVFAG